METNIINSDNRQYNILLVEDNKLNQMIATSFLDKFGYKITIAADGEQALRALEQQQFDLVFMDVQMPVMNGLEATRKIREEGSKVLDRRIPIIAMTANEKSEDREKCLEAGMDDYLSKPLQIKHLQEVISKIMSGKTRRDYNESTPDIESGKVRALLDIRKAFAYLSENEIFLGNLFNSFAESSVERKASLEKAIEARDLSAVTLQAHTLKSMAASIGAERLQDVCLQIEKAGRDKDYALARNLLPEFQTEFRKVSDIVSQIT